MGMKKVLSLLWCVWWIQLSLAQGIFKGKVSEDSTGKIPVFQAEVSVLANAAEVLKITSDFDGSFAIKTAKNTFYSIKVSYPGCKDVSVEFQTDKKGKPQISNALFVMKRDGLRLVGKVRSMKTGMPIERADVVLKDIQTREETHFLTEKDGAYNLKLRYETNYRVSIDKRSPGIVNRYEDTVFFVSTLGFNQPLDYNLDILLRPAEKLTNRTEYVQPENKPASKAVVEVKATLNPDGSPIKTVDASLEKLEIKKEKSTVKPNKKESVEEVPTQDTVKQKKQKEVKEKKEKVRREKKGKVEKAQKSKEAIVADKNVKAAAKEKEPQVEKKSKEAKAEKLAARKLPNNNTSVVPSVVSHKDSVKEKKVVAPPAETVVAVPIQVPVATIYFVKNASFITDFSKAKLKPIVAELKANAGKKVVVNIHAGKDEQNVDMLCQTRLQATRQFFAQNGIDGARIEAKLLGNTTPVNDCTPAANCPEHKLILNRRVEFFWK